MKYLEHYSAAAQACAHHIIASYSTSFYAATNLLAPSVRADIRNLYAVVRTADEIVDGTGAAAGLSTAQIVDELDFYEKAVLAAPQKLFHTDPVLHAYANTARRCGFKDEHIRAFFASMRRDVHQSSYTDAEFTSYVYGSAEVIGLMCLDVFLVDVPVSAQQRAELEKGARALGAAFQKINFLRDVGEDATELGRSYFPQGQSSTFDNVVKDKLIADIYADIEVARAAISNLPLRVRVGVLAATDLFSELTRRIAKLDAKSLLQQRVSVPTAVKARILAQAVVKGLHP